MFQAKILTTYSLLLSLIISKINRIAAITINMCIIPPPTLSANPNNHIIIITPTIVRKNDIYTNPSYAGIVWACSWIGDVYFEGLITDGDYIKASEYYEKGFSQLVPQQKLRLASIYLNDLCSSSHTKEEGMTIIKSCERPQWEIITYTSKEGYEFYSLKKK